MTTLADCKYPYERIDEAVARFVACVTRARKNISGEGRTYLRCNASNVNMGRIQVVSRNFKPYGPGLLCSLDERHAQSIEGAAHGSVGTRRLVPLAATRISIADTDDLPWPCYFEMQLVTGGRHDSPVRIMNLYGNCRDVLAICCNLALTGMQEQLRRNARRLTPIR